jgi:hypothetical protein
MSSSNPDDEQLRQREQEIRDRERAIRLRELEAELHQPPLLPTVKLPTVKQPPADAKLQGKYRQIRNVATFFGLVVVVAVAVKIASQLATAVMVGGIAWVAYKIFMDSKPPKR